MYIQYILSFSQSQTKKSVPNLYHLIKSVFPYLFSMMLSMRLSFVQLPIGSFEKQYPTLGENAFEQNEPALVSVYGVASCGERFQLLDILYLRSVI